MDYFFQEQRWTDTFLSLYVKKFKRIILFLLIAFSAAGAKAQSDVKFNDGVRYSQWVIDSRLGDFYGNTNDFGFTTYNRDLTVKKNVTKWKNGSTNPYIDYVPGLVAKATIEAAEYYKNFDWAKPWFKSVEWYGNKCTVPTEPDNLDAINASKMYFGIYALANGSFSSNAESTTASKATTQLGNALSALKHYNETYAFPASTTLNGKDIAGGWFHKKDYLNQMWLDGQYMGPALLAQLINGYSSYTSNKVSDNDWDLIAKQFTIVWNQCWDDTEKLLYHAFSSEALSYWTSDAEIWTTAQADKTKWTGMSAPGHSSAFWGRAEGWYFLALVDVLEQMPTTNANYNTLKNYLTTLADGIKARQDAKSGCWYQLVGKDGSYTASYYNGNSANPKTNYLESSCTAIFAAAYLKAVRLGLLSNDYKTIGENAYKGAVAQFMKQRTDGTVDLLGCCKSAGLGTTGLGDTKFRDGSNAYYLHGYDVAPTSTTSNYYTEGKVMGAFIMAATEYEIANEKDIRFSYDLAPSYTLAQGGSIKAEALGSGTITYQWCNYSDDSEVSGATSKTFTPKESGTYYCKATNGSTTIQTSTTEVTVEGTDGIENDGIENGSGSKTVTINKANPNSSDITYTISAGETWNTSDYYKVDGNATFTVKAKEGATISQIKLTYTETGDNRVGGSVTVNTGTYTLSDKVGTWTGSANQVVFTTTNTACISSIEVTYTTGTTVLNESDLKYTQSYTTNNKAWTPKANGTIDVSELVTSSSTGAYSITSGTDVATILGTTITALKAGDFTLSQAADDKYKAGSQQITVRIGQDVTNNSTNTYSFTAETNVSDGMTITLKDITMTFGNDGFWSRPSTNSYTGGQVNPQNITENIPTAGTFYKFAPTKSGSLAVKVKLGAKANGDKYNLRPLKVSENGKLINATLADGKTLIGIGQTPAYEKNSYQDNITFRVKANTDYYVYVPGSKLGFYNFTFSPDPTYTVTFNSGSNGTCTTTSISQSSQGERITLPDVTPADGYTFDGWYTDEALTSKVEGTTYTPTADITLHAKCSRITDLFKLSDVTSTKVSVDSKKTVDVTSGNATFTGGSAQLYNGHSSAKDMILSKQINLNGSSSSYLKITLDNSLKIGDEIIINPAASSFKLSDEASNSDAVSFTGSYVIKEGDAVVGKKVIYLYKGSNSLITDINITRYYPESDSRATFTYNNAEIAFSEETAGVKTAYTTTLEIGASKKGESITITPSTKVVGATIKQGESTVSGNISIIVPSEIGSTATSTYTVTSKDGTSTTTYEINVKLVKENVVLVYAQSDGKTEWIWDKNKDSTRPTFEQPTLKVYLANADGTKSEKEVTGIKYMSDVTDVATVGESTGTITIKENANGGAKIYAILKDNDYYNDAQTFFNILVKQGYSYSVAEDATIKNGPDLNQPVYIKKVETKGETTVETNLVKMTFGGWKWSTFKDEKDNNKLKSTYVVNEKTRTDEWKNLITSDESVIASIDGYKTYISGATDAVDESKLPSDTVIYGSTRYGWFKPAKKRSSDNYLETYPYSLPVRGAYMTFEPTQNGTLTVYILQNGAWNTNRSGEYQGINFNDGEIVAGEFRPHSFYICNQRGLNVHQFSPKTFNCTTKQKVKGSYYCDLENHKDDPKNIATWTEFSKYMSKGEQDSIAKNWSSGINGAQKIVQLDNGSYLAIQKGIVKYSFFVTANETYYLFSNFSKLGFCGANFVPSETVKPAANDAHKITLSDVSAYPTPVKVNGDADEDKNKYAWKFGDDIKGYVKDFTIPLFNSITLNRTFKKDQWTTLSLPFNLTQTEVEQIFGTGTQIIVFDKAETTPARTNLTFFYHEIQNVLPGYPYLIRPTLVDAKKDPMQTNSESVDYAPTYTITNGNLTEFTVYNKAINPAIKPHEFKSNGYTAKCTPSYCTAHINVNNSKYSMQYKKGDIFVSEGNGTVYISEGMSYGKGYRSYIEYTGTTPPSAKALSISFSGVEDGDDNGTTTEIRVTELADDVIQTLGIGGVYNLNGQKVADTTRNLPAGIYIVNGRKVVVK